MTSDRLRLAVVRDFREEGWPSMDLAADMLLEHLSDAATGIAPTEIAPRFRRVLESAPLIHRLRASRNCDRLWNRFVTLPRAVRRVRTTFDAFHIADHSYGHLVHSLPVERTGVYCHDLDTFRSLLDPAKEPRPFWFRAMTRRILRGVEQAAIVFHSTVPVGDELRTRGLVAPERLRRVPYGVAPEFTVDVQSPPTSRFDGIERGRYLLHVGSCIPRKRIDLLLELFARVRSRSPDVLLVKVGDAWTEAQQRRIEELRLGPSIRHLGKLSRPELAEAIRGAGVVVIPSDAEGFGLPVIESLACGVPVVASDLPTLREAGGDAARYAPVGDLDAWADLVLATLNSSGDPTERRRRLDWAAQFTWQRHAREIAAAYRELLGRS